MISKGAQGVLLECVIIYHPVCTLSETMLTATVLKYGLGYISDVLWTALYFIRHFFIFLCTG